MAYVDKLLATEERIVLQARRHPLFMVLNSGPYLLGALLLWLAALLVIVFVPDVRGVPIDVILALIIFAASLVPLAIGVYRIAHWVKEQYLVTNYRIIQIEGLVNRRVYDSALEKVNDVILDQSLFGRIFDYGTINIVTGSDAAINDIAGVVKPYEFKRALLEAKMMFGHWDDDLRPAERMPVEPAVAMPPEPGIRQDAAPRQPFAGDFDATTERMPRADAAQSDHSRAIIALTELRNSGLISDAEYAEKLRKLTQSG